jgi:hypothetical protein
MVVIRKDVIVVVDVDRLAIPREAISVVVELQFTMALQLLTVLLTAVVVPQ